MLAVPLYSIQLYDRVLGSGHVETLALLSLAGVMALCVMGVLDWVRTCLLSRIAAGFETRLFPAAVEAAYPKGSGSPGGTRPGQPAPGPDRACDHRPVRCSLAAAGARHHLGPAP